MTLNGLKWILNTTLKSVTLVANHLHVWTNNTRKESLIPQFFLTLSHPNIAWIKSCCFWCGFPTHSDRLGITKSVWKGIKFLHQNIVHNSQGWLQCVCKILLVLHAWADCWKLSRLNNLFVNTIQKIEGGEDFLFWAEWNGTFRYSLWCQDISL